MVRRSFGEMTSFAVTELDDRVDEALAVSCADIPGSHPHVWVNWKSCGWNGWF